MADLQGSHKKTFGNYMLDVFNHGMLSLMLSVGHQSDLFNIMSDMPPSSSGDIAKRAGLQERYVREWLGAMVTGKIVDYNPREKTYHLPPEHSAFLSQAAGPDNMARLCQYVPMLAQVEGDIIECFRKGGGVAYEKYPRLQTIMDEGARLNFDGALVERILPLSDVVNKLKSGIRVLDIGCGQGHVVNLMARAYPLSAFSGYDLSKEAIEAARMEAADWGLKNTRFEVRDITRLDQPQTYDLITAFDVIHDQTQPRQVLKEVHDSLKPDGVFFMMDFQASSHVHENINHPAGPFLYTVSTMHCMTVSLAMGGEGLGTVWGEETAIEFLAEAGFTTRVRHLDGDFLNNYYISRKE